MQLLPRAAALIEAVDALWSAQALRKVRCFSEAASCPSKPRRPVAASLRGIAALRQLHKRALAGSEGPTSAQDPYAEARRPHCTVALSSHPLLREVHEALLLLPPSPAACASARRR